MSWGNNAREHAPLARNETTHIWGNNQWKAVAILLAMWCIVSQKYMWKTIVCSYEECVLKVDSYWFTRMWQYLFIQLATELVRWNVRAYFRSIKPCNVADCNNRYCGVVLNRIGHVALLVCAGGFSGWAWVTRCERSSTATRSYTSVIIPSTQIARFMGPT